MIDVYPPWWELELARLHEGYERRRVLIRDMLEDVERANAYLYWLPHRWLTTGDECSSPSWELP